MNLLLRLTSSLLGLAVSGLVWEQPSITLTGQPGQRVLSTAFHFRNTSAHPVTILALEPSCRCLNADVAKPVWQPGESGEVRAVFTVGPQTGKVLRSIEVLTDEPGPPPLALTLQVNLPDP